MSALRSVAAMVLLTVLQAVLLAQATPQQGRDGRHGGQGRGGVMEPAGASGRTKEAVPVAPWSVRYQDGSANGFRFWKASKAESARFEYSPVTPENSSTGIYSGGKPKKGTLDAKRAGELWRWVRRLEGDASLRAKSRDKGTGAFALSDPAGGKDGGREFLIQSGPLLREFDAFLKPFRGGEAGILKHEPRPRGLAP